MVFASIGLGAIPAESPGPSRALTQYTRHSWTSDDGLPQNSVTAIAQTRDGYLWVSTQQGLARFDGVRFVPVALPAVDGRVEGFIFALHAEGDTLWVGGRNGLYRSEDRAFIEVLDQNGASIGDTRAFYCDREGRLWVAALTSLFRIEHDHARLIEEAGALRLQGLTDIAQSPDGRLCVAGGRVYCLEEGRFTEIEAVTVAAAGAGILKIDFDSSGALWAGTSGRGILRYTHGEIQHWDVDEGLPDGFVRALKVDREGSVWVSCGVSGVARIGPRGLEVLPVREAQPGGVVQVLFEDREGNMWAGSNGGGIERLSPSPFITFSAEEGLADRYVRSVLADRDGAIWVGTAAGGLHRIEDGRIEVIETEHGLRSDDVMALAEDHLGRLWVGTGGGGTYVGEGARFQRVDGPGRVVFSLAEDHEGRMWVGTLAGILRIGEQGLEVVDELRGVNPVAIVVGSDGTLWFADPRGGVVRWRDGEVTRFGVEQGLPDAITVSLYEDGQGVLWIGTHHGGLARMAGPEVSVFGKAQGLCDDSVYALVEGPEGFFWMTSNTGVFAVAREELEAVAAGRLERVECHLFGTADGMRSSECNGGQQPAACRDGHDQIWFATLDGVARVDPRQVFGGEPPPVVFEQLVADGTVAPLPVKDTEIGLSAGVQEIVLRFTALDLSAPERVKFRYRLDGEDRQWVQAADRRVARYLNLGPRAYRFRVQARNPGSSWSEPGAEIAFRVGPHVYQTRWFFVLAVLVSGAIVAVAHRARVGVLERRHRQLEEFVDARTVELETARRELEEANATLERRVEEGIEALRESDRMAAYGRLVAGVAHEVRHPIFALRAAAHLLAQKLAAPETATEEFMILERETERMSRLVDDLLELARPRDLEPAPCRVEEVVDEALTSFATLSEADLAVETAISRGLPEICADHSALVQVMLNLLLNARRHAVGAERVIVGARFDDVPATVRLSVADDGCGIALEDQARIFEPFFSGSGGTGLGLAITLRLVREHGGRLSVESMPGAGAVFTVELPVK